MHPEHRFVPAGQPRPARSVEIVVPIPMHRMAAPSARSTPGSPADLAQNHLLGALSPIDRELFAPSLERVMLTSGQVLSRPGIAPAHVYFPETAIVALKLEPLGGGRSVDVATIGSDGLVGVCAVLGGAPGPEEAVTRVAGSAMRVAVAELERAFASSPRMRGPMLRYAATLLGQMAQTALCVQSHTIEQRLATLILLISDRIGGAPIVVTHEQLGLMLGIRRPGVTQVATTLRDRGLIEYRRGKVVLGDRGALSAVACPCYQLTRDGTGRASRNEDGNALLGDVPPERPLS